MLSSITGMFLGIIVLLEIEEGYWFIRDLRSRNGVKIDGKRINVGVRRRLDPDVELQIAKHKFSVQYDPRSLGALTEPLLRTSRSTTFSGSPCWIEAGLRQKKQVIS